MKYPLPSPTEIKNSHEAKELKEFELLYSLVKDALNCSSQFPIIVEYGENSFRASSIRRIRELLEGQGYYSEYDILNQTISIYLPVRRK
jgi:hypothetical protein